LALTEIEAGLMCNYCSSEVPVPSIYYTGTMNTRLKS